MPYAQAASSGIRSQQESQHGAQQKYQQNSKGRFYGEKMIVCMSSGISYEQLADALYEKGFSEVRYVLDYKESISIGDSLLL